MQSLLADSLTLRVARALYLGLREAWAASIAGRALSRLLAFLRRLSSGSALLSLDAGRSQPLGDAHDSAMVTALGRFYIWARRRLAEGVLGSFLGRTLSAAPESILARRRWLRVAGAGLLGLAAGRLLRLAIAPGDADPASLVTQAVGWGAASLAGLYALSQGERLARVAGTSFTPRAASLLWRFISGSEGERVPEASPAPAARARAVYLVSGLFAIVGLLAGLSVGLAPLVIGAALVAVVGLGLVFYRPEILLPLLVAFPLLDWLARRSLGGLGAAWDELLLLASLALLLLAAVVTRRTELRTVPLALPLTIAVAAGIGSLALTPTPGDVGIFALRITFQPLLFYFLGYLLPRNKGFVRLAVIVFLTTSLLLAVHGLYQYATDAPMPKSWIDAHETSIGTRAYSIIENPNGLGAFLVLGSLLSVSLALARLPLGQRLSMAAVSLVLIAGLGVTFSRGAWLGFALGGLAMAALAYRRLFAGLILGALATTVLLPRVFLDRLTFAFSPEYLAKSASAGRLLMWNVSARRIVEDPWFGSGLGTFGGTSAFRFGYQKLWVDNFYLQLAAEGGLILLFAFLWLLLRAGKGLVAAYLDQKDPYLRAVSAGVFGGFLAVCLANVTAGVWETLSVGAAFWFLTGLASRPPLEEDEPAAEAKARPAATPGRS